jgi:hypothetical protein
MKLNKTFALVALFLSLPFLTLTGHAQSRPTATQLFDLSAFAGATGTFTDIKGGKNFGITAGVDLTYLKLRMFRPAIEVRGTYPLHDGSIDSQKNFLIGPRVEHDFGRFHPYVNFLVGRGEIDYRAGVLPIGDQFFIISTVSTIYSPGGGLDYRLTPHVDVKGDIQYQHWDSPASSSGTIHPVALTLGAVYHFDFNPRHHRRR